MRAHLTSLSRKNYLSFNPPHHFLTRLVKPAHFLTNHDEIMELILVEKNAFSLTTFIFWPISMKPVMWLAINTNLSLLNFRNKLGLT